MKIEGQADSYVRSARPQAQGKSAPAPPVQPEKPFQPEDFFSRSGFGPGTDGLDRYLRREGQKVVVRNLGNLTWEWLKKSLPEDEPKESLRTLLSLFRKTSPSYFEHSNRVAELARMMAEDLEPEQRRAVEMGWEFRDVGLAAVKVLTLGGAQVESLAEQIRELGSSLEQAGALHDIGKVSVPASVLDKPGKLTEKEFELIKLHPLIGEDLLRPLPEMEAILPAVRGHHERWDGKGYPDGLAGEEIPLAARVLCLCDSYDAMTGERPYRESVNRQEALMEILGNSGSQFDPELTGIFVARLARR